MEFFNKAATLCVDEVERITPCASRDQRAIRGMSFPMDYFLADPKVRKYPKPDHCLRVRNTEFESEASPKSSNQTSEESPEPDGEFWGEKEQSLALFSEDTPKQPNGQQDKGRAERAVDMPVVGVRM